MGRDGNHEQGDEKHLTLDELRQRIDSIDGSIHDLLMERSEIVNALIRVKRTDVPGAAFRPGREANMMRRFVSRHRGILPLVTVEHLWREIIATFTHLQAPFDVVVEPGADLRDVARFYFGFTVGFEQVDDTADVIRSICKSEGKALGVVRAEANTGSAWWLELSRDGPQIIAKLPFIEQEGRPAATPSFVISMPLADTNVPDTRLVAMRASNEIDIEAMAARFGGTIAGRYCHQNQVQFLTALPFSVSDVQLEAIEAEYSSLKIEAQVGGYWQPIDLPG